MSLVESKNKAAHSLSNKILSKETNMRGCAFTLYQVSVRMSNGVPQNCSQTVLAYVQNGRRDPRLPLPTGNFLCFWPTISILHTADIRNAAAASINQQGALLAAIPHHFGLTFVHTFLIASLCHP